MYIQRERDKEIYIWRVWNTPSSGSRACKGAHNSKSRIFLQTLVSMPEATRTYSEASRKAMSTFLRQRMICIILSCTSSSF